MHILWPIETKSDRARSEESRKKNCINKIADLSAFSRAHRFVPRSYHTNFENDYNRKLVYKSPHIKLKADLNLGSQQAHALKTISSTAIQNCTKIQLFLPDTEDLENTIFLAFKRFVRISKNVRHSSVITNHQLPPKSVLWTALRYLSRAKVRFTVDHYDQNTQTCSSFIISKPDMRFVSAGQMQKILQYVPEFVDFSLPDFPCWRLSNLTHLKLGNGQLDIDFSHFWECVGSVKSLEVFTLDVYHSDDYFRKFERCASSLANLHKLKQLTFNLHDANENSTWFALAQKLQTVETICRKKDFDLIIKIIFPKKYANMPHQPKAERVPKNTGMFFLEPRDSGVKINLDLRRDDLSDSIVFCYNTQGGKIKLSTLSIKIEHYLPFHQNAIAYYGADITQIEYLGNAVYAEQFNNAIQIHALCRLEKLNCSLIGSHYKQFKILTGGIKVLKELRFLGLSFAPENSKRVSGEHEILPIGQMIQILEGGKGLREFKLNFAANFVNLDGVDLLMKMLFTLSNFQKFTLRIAWKHGYLKEKAKETLLSYLTVIHPVQIFDFAIEFGTVPRSYSRGNLDSEIKYFKSLIKRPPSQGDDEREAEPTAVTIIFIKLC